MGGKPLKIEGESPTGEETPRGMMDAESGPGSRSTNDTCASEKFGSADRSAALHVGQFCQTPTANGDEKRDG